MLNKIKHTVNEWTSKFIKAITIVGTTLFITLNVWANPTSPEVKKEIKDLLKKNPNKEIVVKVENRQSTKNTAKFEAVQDTINALDFAVQNVDKYYPDMKEHLDTMINSFRDQEQKDTVNFLFQQHIFKNLHEEKDQVTAIIYCIERFVFKWDLKVKKKFSNKYDIGTVIDDDEYVYLINFNKWYNKRFKWYFMKLQTIIEQMKTETEQMKKETEQMKTETEQMKTETEQMKTETEQMKKETEQMKTETEQMKKNIEEMDKNIEQMKKEIEGIINTFTANDVTNNPSIKKLVLDTEQLYIEEEFTLFPKLIELSKIAKQ